MPFAYPSRLNGKAACPNLPLLIIVGRRRAWLLMDPTHRGEPTGLPASGGDAAEDLDALFPVVYAELKRVARYHLRGVGAHATLHTTELVHEAYLRLRRDSGASWDSPAHFFGAASRAMRQVLVDFARRRMAAKRGGEWRRISLSGADAALQVELEDILTLNDALERLGAVDSRLHRVVELRFFGGLPEAEIAEILGVSARTVERDWLKARLFLVRELDSAGGTP